MKLSEILSVDQICEHGNHIAALLSARGVEINYDDLGATEVDSAFADVLREEGYEVKSH